MTSNGSKRLRVLVVGESWTKHTVHVKGFDSFSTSEYEEGAGVFLDALRSGGLEVTYVRAHEIAERFPSTKADLDAYDAVVLSDIGANSFLLTAATFSRSERTTNRLAELAEYVRGGGGLVMVGGYMSFTGVDGKARYKMSPLAGVLPVEMLDSDDRVERPEGATVTVDLAEHGVLDGTAGPWPMVLGYNRVTAKDGSTTVVRCGEDPLLVTGSWGVGRVVAFTSDIAPHWAPPEFVQWEFYAPLWKSVVVWAASADLARVG